MNSGIPSRILTFTDQVLIPAYTQIRKNLEQENASVFIDTSFPSQRRDINTMLRKMHASHTSTTKYPVSQSQATVQPFTASDTSQQWIGASLIADYAVLNNSIERSCLKRYCLSVKFTHDGHESFYAKLIAIGTMPQDLTYQPFRYESDQALSSTILENINRQNLLDFFASSSNEFKSFKIDAPPTLQNSYRRKRFSQPAELPNLTEKLPNLTEEVHNPSPTVTTQNFETGVEVNNLRTKEQPQENIVSDRISEPISIAEVPISEPVSTPISVPTPILVEPEKSNVIDSIYVQPKEPDYPSHPHPPDPQPPNPQPPNPQKRIQKLIQPFKNLHYPTHCKLNLNLEVSGCIRPFKDRYDRTRDFIFEYTPQVSDSEVVEYISQISYYHSLTELVPKIQDLGHRLDNWLRQLGQSCSGSTVTYLQHTITNLRNYLYEQIKFHLADGLQSTTAQSLLAELSDFKQKYHEQLVLLRRLENSPLFGFLDAQILTNQKLLQTKWPHLLQNFFQDTNLKFHPNSAFKDLQMVVQNAPLEIAWDAFFDHYYVHCKDQKYQLLYYPGSNSPDLDLIQTTRESYQLAKSSRVVDISAQYIKDNDNRLSLKAIELGNLNSTKSGSKDKLLAPIERDNLIQHVLKKLYPQRPIFLGSAPKPVFPRLERLWDGPGDSSMPESRLGETWCIYPMIRTDPVVWLILAITVGAESLRTITIEDGRLAEEGTKIYLQHALAEMRKSDNSYSRQLAEQVSQALSCGRVKYLHIHQEWHYETNILGSTIQMQFHLVNPPDEGQN